MVSSLNRISPFSNNNVNEFRALVGLLSFQSATAALSRWIICTALSELQIMGLAASPNDPIKSGPLLHLDIVPHSFLSSAGC